MTSTEIKRIIDGDVPEDAVPNISDALWEIAYQAAIHNERESEKGIAA